MPPDDYRMIVFAGSEDVDREYKASFAWERANHGRTMAKVVKSILAMSNLRDGGYIVIGINDENGQIRAVGVLPEHLASLTQDKIADFLRVYAEPYVRISVETATYAEGTFVIIRVHSFIETPVVCRTSFDNILSQGAIYVRSVSGRPQSTPITNYVDMRRLLDLAIERGIRNFLEQQARISPIIALQNRTTEYSRERYVQQLSEFMANITLPQILERGYWRIAIYPTTYQDNRIPSLVRCEDLIRNKQVRNRGWYFPSIPRDGIKRGLDFIWGTTAFAGHLDSWRYHQSGLFITVLGLFEDWVDEDRRMAGSHIRPGSLLDVIGALFQITEVYEFAARLAQENALSDSFTLEIDLENSLERVAGAWPGSGRYFSADYTASVQRLPHMVEFQTADFISRVHDYSYEHFKWLMERFGHDHTSDSVYKREQEKFLGGQR